MLQNYIIVLNKGEKMFEHIHFVEIRDVDTDNRKLHRRMGAGLMPPETQPRPPHEKRTLTGDEFAAVSGLSTEEMGEYIEPTRHAEFHIGGTLRLLLPRAVPDRIRENFLYVQSFSWLCADRTYFTDRRTADTWLLLMTYRGAGELEYMGKTYRLEQGDGFLTDCRSAQKYRTSGENWETAGLHFSGKGADELFRHFAADGNVVFHETGDGYFQLKLEQLLKEYETAALSRDLKVHRTLTDLIVYLIAGKERAQTEKSKLGGQLQYLTVYMQEHLADTVTMDFLAEFTGISKYHLSREFKKLTGCPPVEYLIRLRMEKAKLLLAQTDAPLRVIAGQTGMGNEQYFSRVFHERTGMTPGQYREKFRTF